MGKYFSNEADFHAHFVPFFERLLSHDEIGAKIRDTRMSFRFQATDPAAEIAVNAGDGAGSVSTDRGAAGEEVHVQLKADLLHQLLLGKLRLMPAIMARQISARGLIDKQRALSTLIDSIAAMYRDYLSEQNKQEMLS